MSDESPASGGDGLLHFKAEVAPPPHTNLIRNKAEGHLSALLCDLRYVQHLVKSGTIKPEWIEHYLDGWIRLAAAGVDNA